eukprot:superscaffoldBa00000133_g1953
MVDTEKIRPNISAAWFSPESPNVSLEQPSSSHPASKLVRPQQPSRPISPEPVTPASFVFRPASQLAPRPAPQLALQPASFQLSATVSLLPSATTEAQSFLVLQWSSLAVLQQSPVLELSQSLVPELQQCPVPAELQGPQFLLSYSSPLFVVSCRGPLFQCCSSLLWLCFSSLLFPWLHWLTCLSSLVCDSARLSCLLVALQSDTGCLSCLPFILLSGDSHLSCLLIALRGNTGHLSCLTGTIPSDSTRLSCLLVTLLSDSANLSYLPVMCDSVLLVDCRAPVAVGTAAVSSAEMHSLGMKGRGVCVLHTYMDNLWAFGDKSSPPTLPYAESEGQGVNGEEYEVDEEVEECVEEEQSPGETVIDQVCSGTEVLSLTEQEEEKGEKGNEQEDEDDDLRTPQEIMDALLLQCFFHALKSKVKKSELPLLTSTFLRNHMFSCCPSGKQLDIKKSSYKKLSKFLQAMQQQHNLVRVKELTKGVESIVEVDWNNRELRSFAAPKETDIEAAPVQDAGEGETPYHPPEITTLYSVSARLEPLFVDSNKRKGTILQPTEVRGIVTEYVKKNELVDKINKNYVTINPTLCDCLLEKSEYQEIESLKWDDLFSRTLGKMQECYQVVFPGQAPLIKKGHIEPIDITVASRGSNKKVTLIKNLEVYGLDPSVVATALQHRVQASSVLQPIPGAKDKVLVQIQGNQIQQVGHLLQDHYQIPRKYIQGLEKAPKSGKKK